MNQWKDFFSMTKRERQGAIFLLVLIAVLLGATLAFRYCSHQDIEPIRSVEIEKFESQIDSVDTLNVKPSSARKYPPVKKKRKPRAPKPSKPSPAPRPVDPVPQF